MWLLTLLVQSLPLWFCYGTNMLQYDPIKSVLYYMYCNKATKCDILMQSLLKCLQVSPVIAKLKIQQSSRRKHYYYIFIRKTACISFSNCFHFPSSKNSLLINIYLIINDTYKWAEKLLNKICGLYWAQNTRIIKHVTKAYIIGILKSKLANI